MTTLAELAVHYNSVDDCLARIVLDPLFHCVLILFLDGSAVYESNRVQVIYENCWQ